MAASDLIGILLPIATIQFLGWATPGPNHLMILSASVTSGRAAGIRAALGIAAGAITWALIAVSGIAAIFELFPSLYSAVRLLGAAYLVYLGAKAFRSARRGGMFDLSVKDGAQALRRPFLSAYLVMVTNPKAVLFFGSILTAFVPADGPLWLMLLIVAQMGTLGACLNIFAALFFSSPAVVGWLTAAGSWIAILFGVLFCGLGGLVVYEVLIS